MLDHDMDVGSKPGHGSCFSITVPLASPQTIEEQARPAATTGDQSKLEDLAVLCIDNEADILEGMNMLLDRWGCSVMLAENQQQAAEQIRKNGAPGMVLVDYHLSDQANGLDVMEHLDNLLETKLPAIVITADRSPELEERVRKQGYGLLRKPIRPAALRALMTNTLKQLDD
jgi:CheY-like chemotaxis protein